MLEYARYSRSSTRFSKMSESPSLPRISKIPSTGSRHRRSISRSAALRSGQLARNWSSTDLPFGRRYKSANRSTASIASSSISTPSGPAPSTMNRSRCRSIRGLSAKSTKARFSPALRSMSEASDRASPPWFVGRDATSLLRRAKRVTARPTTTCRASAARHMKPLPGAAISYWTLLPAVPALRARELEDRAQLTPPFSASCAVSLWQVYSAGKYRVAVPENDFIAHSVPCRTADPTVIVMVMVPVMGLLGVLQCQ